MADLAMIDDTVVGPGLALLPPRLDTPPARVELLAIGLQESRFERRQQDGGPARGFWQFERSGGVQGVLAHAASKAMAIDACVARGLGDVGKKQGQPDWLTLSSQLVYDRLDKDDLLACAFARLLLVADPQPLPAVGDASRAWQCYLRTWRPGRPHPETWHRLYQQAQAVVAA